MSTEIVERIEFDQEQFSALCESIRKGLATLSDTIFPALRPALDLYFDANLVLPVMRKVGYKIVRWALDMLATFLNIMVDFLEGLLVPLFAFVRGALWADNSEYLHSIAGRLDESMKALAVTWQGEGQQAFALHGARHAAKTTELAELAKTLKTQLYGLAAGSVGCYVAIGAIISAAVAACSAAAASTAADGPVGPSAAGGVMVLAYVKVSAVLALLASLIAYHVTTMETIGDKSDAVAKAWPEPGVARYDDGSLADGDDTSWSTER
jgi:hypothetical protein